MNEEEAREILKTMKENIDKKYLKTRNSVAIETVLSMLEEKDKQIDLMAEKLGTLLDLMAEKLGTLYSRNEPCDLSLKINCEKYKTCKECIKQYFENKAKE